MSDTTKEEVEKNNAGFASTILPIHLPSISKNIPEESQFPWIGTNQLLPSEGKLLGLSLSSLSSIPSMPHPSLIMSGYSNYSGIEQYSNSSQGAIDSSNDLKGNHTDCDQQFQPELYSEYQNKMKKTQMKITKTTRQTDNRLDQDLSVDDEGNQFEKRQKIDYTPTPTQISDKSVTDGQHSLPQSQPHQSYERRTFERSQMNMNRPPPSDTNSIPFSRLHAFEDFGRILDYNTEPSQARMQELHERCLKELQEASSLDTSMPTKHIWDIIAPVAVETLCPAFVATYYAVQEQDDEFGNAALDELSGLSEEALCGRILQIQARTRLLDERMVTELSKSRALGLVTNS